MAQEVRLRLSIIVDEPGLSTSKQGGATFLVEKIKWDAAQALWYRGFEPKIEGVLLPEPNISGEVPTGKEYLTLTSKTSEKTWVGRAHFSDDDIYVEYKGEVQ